MSGQVENLPMHSHLLSPDADAQRAIIVERPPPQRVGVTPLQRGGDAKEYLFHVEGLGYVILRSQLKGAQTLARQLSRGNDQDGSICHLTDALQDGPTIQVGEDERQEDKMGMASEEGT